MKIKDIMTSGIIEISSDSSVKTVAEVMKKNDVGAVPIQEEGVLRGMLTDRDIVIRAVAEGRDPASTSVSDIMTSKVFTCFDDQDVSDVAAMMKQQKIRRIVVLNHDKQPIGIVSLGDIAAHGNIRLAAEALERISEPVHSK
jgi:CBS domain-containing protein